MSSKVLFLFGVLTVLLILPLFYALGVPSFDVVLVALFGEGSVWAIVFSLALILLMVQGVRKFIY